MFYEIYSPSGVGVGVGGSNVGKLSGTHVKFGKYSMEKSIKAIIW
jgi:hypothetical protein